MQVKFRRAGLHGEEFSMELESSIQVGAQSKRRVPRELSDICCAFWTRTQPCLQVSETKEALSSSMKLGPVDEMTLVCNGRILDDGNSLNEIKNSDTIFVVLASQPPSWKPPLAEDSSSAPSGPLRPVVRAPGSREDDPWLEQIKELELAICMLERSIEELKCAGPDPDFDEAIEENIVAIAR